MYFVKLAPENKQNKIYVYLPFANNLDVIMPITVCNWAHAPDRLISLYTYLKGLTGRVPHILILLKNKFDNEIGLVN